MKNTALISIHENLGAKILPFAGYNMPILYEGVNAEHETVRNSVGVFDVSHMGEFFLKGPKALDLIEKVRTKWEVVETPIFGKDRDSILKLI